MSVTSQHCFVIAVDAIVIVAVVVVAIVVIVIEIRDCPLRVVHTEAHLMS